MEDEIDRNDDEADSYEHPPLIIQPVNPQPITPPIATTGVGDAGKAAIHEQQGASQVQPGDSTKKSSSEKWMTWLTAIIAVATVANVIIFWLESEDTSKEIGKLSTKAGEIVGSMNTALSDSRQAISSAFEENKSALDANQKQTKRALDSSIDIARWTCPHL